MSDMRAMVLEGYEAPLVSRAVPKPAIRPHDVLIRVGAAGVCATDLSIVAGSLPSVQPPRILGHEIAGVVSEVGSEVGNIHQGDTVVVCYYLSCGDCDYCRIGRHTLCTRLGGRIGLEFDGGFAEFVTVPARSAFPISSAIPFAYAAVLPDAGAAAWHAVCDRGHIGPGMQALVVGAGGLGLMAIQMAALCGAEVAAVDKHDAKLEAARDAGAASAVLVTGGRSPLPESLVGACDVAIDFVGERSSLALALQSLRPGGRLVMVSYGYGGEQLMVEPKQVIMKEIEVVGSRGSSRQDLIDVIRLVESGRVRPVVGNTFALEEANLALESLRAGGVIGRCVLAFDR